MITQERLKELFHYCPESGLLTRLVSTCGRVKAGDIVGCPNSHGYLRVMIDNTSYLIHRLAWLYAYGEWPNQIDHIDGIRSRNGISNLRNVTQQENLKNKRINRNNSSGVTGVQLHRLSGRWYTEINVDCLRVSLGYFDYKWDAICARKSAERKYGFHMNHGRKC